MNIEDEITKEQARHLQKNFSIALVGDFFSVLLVIIFFWNETSRKLIFFWTVIAVSFYLISMYWNTGKLKEGDNISQAHSYLRSQVIGYGINSAIWGALFILLFPSVTLPYQFALLFSVPLLTIGAMYAGNAHYPSAVSGFLPLALCAFTISANQNTDFFHLVAAAISIFIFAMLYFAKHFNQLFIKSLQLRYENTNLLLEVRAQREAAETANLAKSRFLAAASHDLRQPTHALTLYLGALNSMSMSDKARTVLNNAEQCARVMDELFRSLLEMSKLDASVIIPNIVSFPVSEILQRLHTQFRPEADSKGLKFCIVYSSMWIRSDPLLVERILCNFVSNAIRYTDSGKILIGCRRFGATMRICVYDTGIGIELDQKTKVFEEFYQVETSCRDRRKGLGLGLAIVQKLAQLLQANVTVYSQIGKGSCFSIDSPLDSTYMIESRNNTHDKTEARVNQSEEPFLKASVMVIDDEALIRDATRLILEQWQFTVHTAIGKNEAITEMKNFSRPPDILICDYRLNGTESGIDVIAAIRDEFNIEIPALLITGDTGADRTNEIKRSGLPVLYKPIRKEDLYDALVRLLQSN